MTKWIRRIRAAIGMGLIWGAAWGFAGFLLARISSLNSDVPFALLFAPLGFLSGVLFSGIIVVIEGRRQFERMSLPRFAGWGALTGLLLTGIFVSGAAFRAESLGVGVVALAIVPTLAGAICAVGSLALARQSDRRQFRSAHHDENEADVERREI